MQYLYSRALFGPTCMGSADNTRKVKKLSKTFEFVF